MEETPVQSWTFDCQQCSFTSEEPSENAALSAADKHADYAPGHFDFEIIDPSGKVRYP